MMSPTRKHYFAKLLLIVALLFLSSDVFANDRSPSGTTYEETLKYFRSLTDTEKRGFITEVVEMLQKDLPQSIDDVTNFVAINYLPSQNQIVRVYETSIKFGTFDAETVDYNVKRQKVKSLNTMCTTQAFRMFMFDAATILSYGALYCDGQMLFRFFIDKNDCIKAGYGNLVLP